MSTLSGGQSIFVPRLALFGSGTIGILMWMAPTRCDGKNENESNNINIDDETSDDTPDEFEKFIITTIAPLATKLGYGGIMGFCSGMAAKKIGQLVAVVIGGAFIGVQYLQYKGYIQLDFQEIQDKVVEQFDADGDGELTSNDFILIWKTFKKMVEDSLPSSSGFVSGFMLGLYLM
jgi:FUN14 domain-containing protein 1